MRIASVAQLWPSGAGGVAMLCLRTIKITVVVSVLHVVPTSMFGF